MLRRLPILALLLLIGRTGFTQVILPVFPDSLFTTYYHQRATLFSLLPKSDSDILFVGNSITDGGEWGELFNDVRIKNRGISGDITTGVMHRLPDIASGKPAKVFLLIGVNDVARGIATDSIFKNIVLIADYLQQESPRTQVYVQSILPVNAIYGKFSGHTQRGDSIKKVNALLYAAADAHHYTYIDIYTPFCDETGKMNTKYSNDGLHLLGEGYLLWKHLVFPYVFNMQEKPSLIPEPVQLSWGKGRFPLYQSSSIYSNDTQLQPEASQLQMLLAEKKTSIPIVRTHQLDTYQFVLQLDPALKNKVAEEGYQLKVGPKEIKISAAARHGIYNGIQTLRQLLRDGSLVDACEITDQPAYAWRGFMIDVGRNYMPMSLLKQQIDVMGQYKFNVFHFHPTEDIAWRLQIDRYPQLTAPENMLRNKGQYYSKEEMKELIAYAAARHITVVLEIDMPGHSGAFKRAMGTDMQSGSGKEMVRNILQEVIDTYKLPYIHIGSDEVRITDTSFVPEMTALIERAGKKVIGWQPGGNYNATTIRQLWREDNNEVNVVKSVQFVDSKHLYLNHMDPLEAVTSIFNRQLAKRQKGDSLALGATLCVWHDRAVAQASDVLTMNPVYPGLLTFAERSWRGGGKEGWIANPSDGNLNDFVNYEKRLIEHRDLYFNDKPFPYVPQSQQTWRLFGPFNNEGEVTKSFSIESKLLSDAVVKETKQVQGGTIVMRHWWWPWIAGAIDAPAENTTWYAQTKIWSDHERQAKFWIGFYNLSRSPATETPPLHAWDYRGSTIWLNAQLIEPPSWKRAGLAGHSEIPLIDEGYEYRTPTVLTLKKGWNTVVVKTPIASFKARNGQTPTKWMFSFVEVK